MAQHVPLWASKVTSGKLHSSAQSQTTCILQGEILLPIHPTISVMCVETQAHTLSRTVLTIVYSQCCVSDSVKCVYTHTLSRVCVHCRVLYGTCFFLSRGHRIALHPTAVKYCTVPCMFYLLLYVRVRCTERTKDKEKQKEIYS